MLNRLYFLICFCLIFNSANAQEEEVINPSQTSKSQSETHKGVNNGAQERKTYTYQRSWSFGGNLGLSFWNSGTDILIAPKAYYNISPKFLTGYGITYIYSDYDDEFFGYHQNSIGGSILAAVRPIPMLQFSVEYEGLQTNRGGYAEDEYWNNAIYLGASFVSGPVSFGFRYDIIYDPLKSVYGSAFNPVIGFYF
jgi:hypothetical protein